MNLHSEIGYPVSWEDTAPCHADLVLNGFSEAYYSYPDFKAKIRAEGIDVDLDLRLKYAGSSQELTFRSVHVTRVLVKTSETYILGHCYLRNENRVFACSKIQAVVDIRSRKLVPKLREWLFEMQIKKYLEDPEQYKASLQKPRMRQLMFKMLGKW